MPQPKNPRKRGRPRKKPNWLELPADITANILHRLGAIAILMSAQKVCSAWYKICKDPAMWRVIDMRNSGASVRKRNKISGVIKKLLKQAVNRSQGQLVDINIEYFGTNEVIEYIADRSSHLRRIRVLSCSIEEDCWRKFFRKVPLLEQLSLPLTYISPGALEDASRYCPMLKSLKCGNIGYMLDGEIVLAIVCRMTELRRLALGWYIITNEHLKAILDGCPQLESLDLCFSSIINLDERLKERCMKQIKHLTLPRRHYRRLYVWSCRNH